MQRMTAELTPSPALLTAPGTPAGPRATRLDLPSTLYVCVCNYTSRGCSFPLSSRSVPCAWPGSGTWRLPSVSRVMAGGRTEQVESLPSCFYSLVRKEPKE